MRFPCLVLFVVAFGVGCRAHHPGDAVRSVRFEGNESKKLLRPPSASDAELRNAMSHPQARWQSFLFPGWIEPAWLDRKVLDSDAWRIEIWYANHGYFDARFLGWEIERYGRNVWFFFKRRQQPVRIRGYVDAGLPSRVRSVEIEGLDSLGGPLQKRIRALVGVREGDVYSTEAYDGTLDAVRGLLQEKSYAYARVVGDVEVHPEEHAVDVRLSVVSGRTADFGPVTLVFKGKRTVPEEIVREYVTIEEGKPFRAHEIATTRSALFALRVFNVVDVTPDLSDPSADAVPVRIELSQGLSREVKLGPGVEVETGKATAYLTTEWEDNNLGGRLWRLDGTARAGVSSVLADGGITELLGPGNQVSPIADARVTLAIPHLAGPAWSTKADTHIEYGIEPGYRFFSPEVAPSVSFNWRQKFTFTAGYQLRYFDYVFDPDFDISKVEKSPLKLDLTDPYLISLMEQRVTYEGRNDPFQATRGWYWTAAIAEAGGPFQGNFQFIRTLAEVRAYRSVVRLFGWDPKTVIAGRLGGGLIVPYGDGPEASVPYQERLYLGGSTTVRGWGDRRLGPSVLLSDGTSQPAGGLLSVYGNLEIRKAPFIGPFGLGAFADVGRVWDAPLNFTFSGLQWSVGGGPRVGSPIGTIRLDAGVRLGDAPYFETQPRWTVHFGLSEAF